MTNTTERPGRKTSLPPGMTLHSGAMGTVPNSPGFLELAARIRPDVTELDVRISRDGVPVLSHDPHFDIEGESRLINDCSYRELKSINLNLLSLKEAAEFCRSKGLFMNLDLKTDEALDGIYKLAGKERFLDLFYLSGCHSEQVDRIRREYPGLAMLLNTEGKELESSDPAVYREYCSSMFAKGRKWNCRGLNVCYSACRQEMIDQARALDFPVMVWTINCPASMSRFMQRGIASITTDRPELFKAASSYIR